MDGTSDTLAKDLNVAAIPFVFHTVNSDTVPALADSFGVQVVPKPVPESVLIEAVEEMFRREYRDQS